jgi:hypothetical protein
VTRDALGLEERLNFLAKIDRPSKRRWQLLVGLGRGARREHSRQGQQGDADQNQPLKMRPGAVCHEDS